MKENVSPFCSENPAWEETFRCEATEFVFTRNWLCFEQNFMQNYSYSNFKYFRNIEVSLSGN